MDIVKPIEESARREYRGGRETKERGN